MTALRVNRTDPQYGDLASRRSAGSKAIALLRIGARSGPPHHSATAKEYCPSSSAVARHLSSSGTMNFEIGRKSAQTKISI
jgi:hypothetical protein